MKHVKALAIKFIMTAIVSEIVLYMSTELKTYLYSILYIAAAVTIIAYIIIGDLLILPATNNTVATIADIGLALPTIYIFNFLWNVRTISFTNALICAVVIGVGEWFFHKYVSNNVLEKSKE